MKLLAIAHLAEITCKWPHLKEAQKREELSNTILDGSPRQAPLVGRLQREACTGDAGCTLLEFPSARILGTSLGKSYLDAVGFIENETMKMNRMNHTFNDVRQRVKSRQVITLTILLDDTIITVPALEFLAIHGF